MFLVDATFLDPMPLKIKLLWLILFTTLLKCVVACSVELGNDEVYYLSYAQHLQWNYFDHPPIIALLIRLTTCNLFFKNELFVRLGAIVFAAINTWLIFKTTAKIKNEQAGFIAALLFTASPYCCIVAGLFILPDAPQLFFWICGIALLVDIISEKDLQKENNYKILLFGLVAGLCIMSKIHGGFLWIGFLFYIVMYQRSLLANPYLYVAMGITATIISPIVIWNIQNNFITYTYHSDRVSLNREINPQAFFRELIGGMLYNNPINYVLILISFFSLNKVKGFISLRLKRLLLLLSLPLIILLLTISVFRDTLPHWSGPAYISLIMLTGCFISQKLEVANFSGKKLFRFTVASVFLLTLMVVSALLLINFMPGTIGKKEPDVLGEYDFTLDMFGWKNAKQQFEKLYIANRNNGVTSTTFLINNKWFPGAHIDNYIAQPLHLDYVAVGPINDIHTYAWLNEYRKKLHKGDDAYFITVSNYYADAKEKYSTLFEHISAPVIIPQFRGGKPVRNMYVYLLKNYKVN